MRIGELAAATGTTTKTLRFYEDSGLLPPPERTTNGYRDYGPDAVSRLAGAGFEIVEDYVPAVSPAGRQDREWMVSASQ